MVPLAFFIIFNRNKHTGISITLQRRDEAKPFIFATTLVQSTGTLQFFL